MRNWGGSKTYVTRIYALGWLIDCWKSKKITVTRSVAVGIPARLMNIALIYIVYMYCFGYQVELSVIVWYLAQMNVPDFRAGMSAIEQP